MASPFSVVHPTSFSQFFSRPFFRPRPFSPVSSVVSFNCFLCSSSTTAMTSKTIMKSTPCQTNTTVSSYSAHCLKASIFKTLALEVGNELNIGTIAPSTRRAFFKIMYNVFLLSTKKFPFEQYHRLHLLGPKIVIRETKSNNVFVLTHTSFDQNNFYFLHAVQEAVDALRGPYGFWLLPETGSLWPVQTPYPTQPCNPFSKLPTWLLVAVSSSSLLTFFAVSSSPLLTFFAVSSSSLLTFFAASSSG